MLACVFDVLSGQFNSLLGRVNDNRGPGLISPTAYGGLAAWYDVSDVSSMVVDGSNRVSLLADKSGNSVINGLVGLGTSGNYASTPDAASVDFFFPGVGGDFFRIDARLMANDWTPSAAQAIVAKGTDVSAAANYLFALVLNTDATLTLHWSDGSAASSATSSTLPFSDLSGGFIRALIGYNDNDLRQEVSFYTSSDGVNYNLLNTAANITPRLGYNNTNAIGIGAFTGGTSGNFSGIIHSVMIEDSLGTQLNVDFTAQAKLAASFVASTGQTITVNTSGAAGARISGARDLYQGTVANQPVLTTVAGNRNYLTFDGTNDYLAAASFQLIQPETVHFVGSQITWVNGDAIWDGRTSLSGSLVQGNTSTPQLTAFAGQNIGFNTDLALNTTALVSTVFNGASVSFFRVNRGTSTTGNSGSNNMLGFTLSARGGGTQGANITASEVVIYSTAQTAAQCDQFALYAGRKWGFAA